MSDIMRSMPFGQIMSWIITEQRLDGSIFGVRKQVAHTDHKYMPIFNEKLESPYGPAAGPHTKLAQNIIAAYAAGAARGSEGRDASRFCVGVRPFLCGGSRVFRRAHVGHADRGVGRADA